MAERSQHIARYCIGRGLCILAAYNGDLQVLDWLLENGFDHDIINYKGRSHDRSRMGKRSWACADAAIHSNLPALQWLLMNSCVSLGLECCLLCAY
mmetsp:Transcript_25620/g.46261  ORF Transcript_25620/g.46261 Transcript_25620/m.46261 type:complete len:96 (+) Transcript_25620:282-569(+)